MQIATSITTILNPRSIIITILAVASTFLCLKYKIHADFPLSLIGTAVVFPIVFSIGGAYKRRESALKEYGSIKAHGRAIFFASRDWVPDTDEQIQTEIKDLLLELLHSCRDLFGSEIKDMPPKEREVYTSFSKISVYIKSLRSKNLPSGETSRCNQFLSKMINSFENLKHIYQYRTPRSLRSYSRIFIMVLPIVYGPYFADIAKDFTKPFLGYVMPVLFTLVLTSLDYIQDHLENPFDQVGQDDIIINAEKFVERLDL